MTWCVNLLELLHSVLRKLASWHDTETNYFIACLISCSANFTLNAIRIWSYQRLLFSPAVSDTTQRRPSEKSLHAKSSNGIINGTFRTIKIKLASQRPAWSIVRTRTFVLVSQAHISLSLHSHFFNLLMFATGLYYVFNCAVYVRACGPLMHHRAIPLWLITARLRSLQLSARWVISSCCNLTLAPAFTRSPPFTLSYIIDDPLKMEESQQTWN